MSETVNKTEQGRKNTWSGYDLEAIDMKVAATFADPIVDIQSAIADIDWAFEGTGMHWIKRCITEYFIAEKGGYVRNDLYESEACKEQKRT